MGKVCLIKCESGHEHFIQDDKNPELFRLYASQVGNSRWITVQPNTCPTCKATYLFPCYKEYFSKLRRIYSPIHGDGVYAVCVMADYCPSEAIQRFAEVIGAVFGANGDEVYVVALADTWPALYSRNSLKEVFG